MALIRRWSAGNVLSFNVWGYEQICESHIGGNKPPLCLSPLTVLNIKSKPHPAVCALACYTTCRTYPCRRGQVSARSPCIDWRYAGADTMLVRQSQKLMKDRSKPVTVRNLGDLGGFGVSSHEQRGQQKPILVMVPTAFVPNPVCHRDSAKHDAVNNCVATSITTFVQGR